jgi:hypothetical protein
VKALAQQVEADRKLNEQRYRTLNARQEQLAQEAREERSLSDKERKKLTEALVGCTASLGRIERHLNIKE